MGQPRVTARTLGLAVAFAASMLFLGWLGWNFVGSGRVLAAKLRPGMSRAEVRAAAGEPDERLEPGAELPRLGTRDTFPVPTETWVYHRGFDRLAVLLRDDRVETVLHDYDD